MGSAESLIDALRDRPRLRPIAQLILDAAENGAELVSRLLAFSRKQSLSPKVMDSQGLFQALLPLLRRTIRAHGERLLNDLGYRVTTSSNGVDALQRLADASSPMC
jgi:hypothetical protein